VPRWDLERTRAVKTIEISQVSALAAYVKPGCSEPLLLTEHGRVIATVVPADEDNAASMLLSINPQFRAILERSRVRLESEGGLSSTEARKRLGIPAKPGGPTSRPKPRPRGRRG
jgi:antitoxin (DNA-binding transcriptional repressor) of toxin-antitoxin stability system